MNIKQILGAFIVLGLTLTDALAQDLQIIVPEAQKSAAIFEMKLDLIKLQKLLGKIIDPTRIQVFGLDSQGKKVPCAFHLSRTAMDKGMLSWKNPGRQIKNYYLNFARMEGQCQKKFSIGNGDFIYSSEGINRRGVRKRDIGISTGSGTLQFKDMNNDGTSDLINPFNKGIRIFINSGSRQNPSFSQRNSFFLTTKQGKLIPDLGKFNPYVKNICFVDLLDGKGEAMLISTYYRYPNFVRALPAFKGFIPSCKIIEPAGIAKNSLGSRPLYSGDIDNDGIVDLIELNRNGSIKASILRFYKGEKSAKGLTFRRIGFLKNDAGKYVGHGYNINRLAIVDWNNDGKKDLLYGYWKKEGLHVALNVSKGNDLKFSAKTIPVKDEKDNIIKVGTWNQGGNLVDMDSDGKDDLLLSGSPTRWYKNIGTQEQKKFRGPKVLEDHFPKEVVQWNMFEDMNVIENKKGEKFLVFGGLRALWIRPFEKNIKIGARRMIPISKDKLWFGCPDPNENNFNNSKAAWIDWDKSGIYDLLVVSESAWRFGLVHWKKGRKELFKYRDDHKTLKIPGNSNWAKYAPGRKKGTFGIYADPKNFWMSYLSWYPGELLSSAGGEISFWFKPEWNHDSQKEHALFYSGYSLQKKNQPSFELFRNQQDGLSVKLGTQLFSGNKINFNSKKWYQISLKYFPDKFELKVDGKSYLKKKFDWKIDFGQRFFLGSRGTPYIQPSREYPNRVKHHNRSKESYASGIFQDLRFKDKNGNTTAFFPFNRSVAGNPGPSGERITIGYRSNVGFADFNGDGLTDITLVIADGHRLSTGDLTLFVNQKAGRDPVFAKGKVLKYKDGSPIRCTMRTKVYAIDWNNDGLIDLISSTDGPTKTERENYGVQLLINCGSKENPVFQKPLTLKQIQDRMTIHHEPNLGIGDVDGDGKLDILAKSDGGVIHYFNHEYLHGNVAELLANSFKK